nr:hypothetical protein GCM10020093_093780 [Planobispora longispora]
MTGTALVLEVLDGGDGIGRIGGNGGNGGTRPGDRDAGGSEDGAGRGGIPAAGAREGVGLTSMRERATELGGSCTFEERAEGGTLVRVVLPTRMEERG